MEAEYRDALVHGAARGRAAGLNPGNRFERVRLHVLGEHLDEVVSENPDGTRVVTRVHADHSRTIINPVDSPDVCFKWSVNPYRGCEHGCIYCYARPSHELLGLSCGLDFETQIFAKFDAARLLRHELLRPGWKGENLVFSGITDPYQPVESKLRITRACLEVCAEFRQPVSFITKNHLITRDVDLLGELARHGAAGAAISVTTLDTDLAARMEPRASSPADRLRAIRKLTGAGVPVRVMVAPIVPGLTDHEMPAILEAAADAGAVGAGYVLLRLPHQDKDLFVDWLGRQFPERAGKVTSKLRQMRGGKLYNAKWFERGRGAGPLARQLETTFDLFAKRYGLTEAWHEEKASPFRPPPRTSDGDQPLLFAV
ncbi:MAG TPA: PA0069 family radical SAM protein [Phycisphaerales bacterium]|nr:PA0069 family radical SAM protein [Phycisphaerales bacterium]